MRPSESSILYNPELLSEEARQLSKGAVLSLDRRPLTRFQPLLNKSRDVLTDAYRKLATAAQRDEEITPAAEWIIDNFYIMQEQFQLIKEDLPYEYYIKLPRLKSGIYSGMPRVYEIVNELASFTDNVIDLQNMDLFIKAYQESEPLSLGELWAIPIFIRFVMIRKLEDRAVQILKNRIIRQNAKSWVRKILSNKEKDPALGIRTLIEMTESYRPLTPTFLVSVTNQLQMAGALTELERAWMDGQFRSWQTTIEEEIRHETQRQTQLQVSVRNAVMSLRRATETDWSEFIENRSIVEQILRLDPAGIYPQMDFRTRDLYRQRVEKISTRCPLTEFQIAEQLLLRAENASQQSDNPSAQVNHVGYYLIDEGKHLFNKAIKYHRPFLEWLRDVNYGHSSIYLFSILLVSSILITMAFLFTRWAGANTSHLVMVMITSILPAVELAVVFINWILTLVMTPRFLPRLGFENGIPDHCKTLVVVPTLITSVSDTIEQLELLEVRYLANPDKNLRFALLSDYQDAPKKEMSEDIEILNAAIHEVRSLNRKYNDNSGDHFFLLHRERLLNEKQRMWMGWERKRGKLEELTRLLRKPEEETSFTAIEGDFKSLIQNDSIRYVITLDADTQLPPGSARDLVRTAAHPLNSPYYDPKKKRVTKGYGILQPRISISPETASKSPFAQIFSGNVGIDPYTTAVSDVYQDLMGEGSYTGKGLFVVDTFREVLDRKFPDNAILSHDLLEGNYVRTALVSDIELFDDYPSNYMAYSKRLFRWVRGDWQIIFWLFPRVPGLDGWVKNPINLISKWKIFDNLRRSMTPLALLLFLLFGWTYYPGPPLFWTLLTIVILAFPIYSNFSRAVFLRPPRVAWKLYFKKLTADLKVNSYQVAMVVISLAHQAYLQIDAILRTLWRMFFIHRNLLEWTSAKHADRGHEETPLRYFRKMWVSMVWGIMVIILTGYFKPVDLLFAIPFGGSWIIAPWILWTISKPAKKREVKLSEEDEFQLHLYARRTWMFYEKCVGPQCSWLPPDNIQEDPPADPAKRTSPTNMGLSLVSALVAFDFGYITRNTLLYRVGQSLGSMKLLDRYRGHFYNWYNTTIGAVLSPRYISTVDSGNLAGCLITLKQGLLEVPKTTWPNPAFYDGLRDTVRVLKETIEDISKYEIISEILSDLNKKIAQLESLIPEAGPKSIIELKEFIEKARPVAGDIGSVTFTAARSDIGDVILDEIENWFSQPMQQLEAQYEEISFLFPLLEKGQNLEDVFKPQSLRSLQKKLDTHIKKSGNEHLETAFKTVSGWIQSAGQLADWCQTLINEMDFSFLYMPGRGLFSIGFNVDRMELDESTYDLLASEARLASFIAIAKGDVPPRHWFRLSRRLTEINKKEILLSWGGTMFEYLMPFLFMRRYEGTLLSETYDNVVLWQINYGNRRKRPWGFSESAYYVLNMDFDYQYRAFGAPGLGLRRGLAEEYVVAPYASMLALMVNPRKALENLKELREEGGYGPLGFYEAIDYTKTRLTPDLDSGIVRTYMVHHQAMSLISIYNLLNGNRVQKLFHSSPLVQSCELLLQERIPKGIPITEPNPIEVELEPSEQHAVHYAVEYIDKERLFDSLPRVHLLSNGHYTAMITNAGTGYSNYDGYRLTRWTADHVRDSDGFYIYVRDIENNDFWTNGYQPTAKNPDRYEVWFHTDKIQIARVDHWIETFTEVCVSPEDNIELRRCTLTNYADRPRRLELTSFIELVLNYPMADIAHPAFSKLFIQTDYLPDFHALLAKRRPRNEDEEPIWMVHTLAVHNLDYPVMPLEFETDRNRFIGRGRTLSNPRAMDEGSRLSDTVGSVLDPIFSLRRYIDLGPGEKIQVTFGLGTAHSREEAEQLADRYDNPYSVDRAFELAKVFGLVQLGNMDISGERALYFQNMAGSLLYGNPLLRTTEAVMLRNRKKQPGLWSYGISGDFPLMAVFVKKFEEIKTVKELLKAHALWRLKGLDVDLVFLNEHPPSYADEMQDAINQAVQTSPERVKLNQRGGIFNLRVKDMPDEDLGLLQTFARVVVRNKLPKLDSKFGDLDKTIISEIFSKNRMYQPAFALSQSKKSARISEKKQENMGFGIPENELKMFNGYGGFSEDGNEYIIKIRSNSAFGKPTLPPTPWINVIANEKFGFLATESGAGYTWSQNSRENRLTPWSNDPVRDPVGEALYIRDEKDLFYWSPTPEPVSDGGEYEVKHGFGYTRYSHHSHGIEQELLQFVPRHDPIKISRLTLKNTSSSTKELSIFTYIDLVLGIYRESSSPFIITKYDKSGKLILAQNHYNNEFAGRITFHGIFTDKESSYSFTTDRLAFIGRNGDLSQPSSLDFDTPLDGRTGAGYDPCSAFQVPLPIDPGETVTLYILLGEAENEQELGELTKQYKNADNIEKAFEEVTRFWKDALSVVKIETPVPEIDLMVNGWLLYQDLSCRVWARSAFYQSGGAYGFRDQLQDVLALMYTLPDLAREQILRHAAHQFTEGDVLHWWHPPTGRGIRTRFSDDLLWLPYATACYVHQTGDWSILDEQVPYITSRALEPNEDEVYLVPEVSHITGTLYDHCCKAIDKSLTKGAHGLPLMGSGDWNDGMNRVGHEGKGESTWLGFFLYHILGNFIDFSKKRSDDNHSKIFEEYQSSLKKALNEKAWDGEWFTRAFYDDGTPLGSSKNEECRIDAIAQAWSIISKAAKPEYAAKAMDSVEQYLISDTDRIIRLLTPPFDKTTHNPGYIKGYIPGVRENGGQYTHGALWVVRAMAELGRGNRAAELLEMLSPVSHARTFDEVEVFKVEPYSVPADVYGVNPHIGRGGWTWYTGSAGWMYRIAIESVLGFRLVDGEYIEINPCISASWNTFRITYRPKYSDSVYNINVENPDHVEQGIVAAYIDGEPVEIENVKIHIKLIDDNSRHEIHIIMGESETGARRPIKSDASTTLDDN